MQLNEDTYRYMKKASSQIEGITCALGSCIEHTIDAVVKYHYRTYNKLLNEIRQKHIDAIAQIEDIFESARDVIENIAIRMKASDATRNVLCDELEDFEASLHRLVIYCQNIPECNTSTENPNIQSANDEIYRCFSGYKQIISEYPLEKPADEDMISSIIYSFYRESVNIYDNLFCEYDKMMDRVDVELQSRRKELTNMSQSEAVAIVKKATVAKNIAKTTVTGTAKIIAGIQKNEAFTAIDAGIGLIGKVSEQLGKVVPKESLAQKSLKHVETLCKSMDLIGSLGIKEGFGLDDNTMGAVKLVGAAMCIRPFDLHQLDKEGKLDVMVEAASFTTEAISCVGTAISGKPFATIAKLPKVADKTMNLIESMAKYYEDNGVHVLPKVIDIRMHHLAETIKEYEQSVEEYKAKLIRKIPARRPKAPPWVRVHNGISFASDMIDKL